MEGTEGEGRVMASPKFFDKFPAVEQNIYGTKRVISDISRSVRMNPSILIDSVAYYDYVIRDGERPDHVAFSEYGKSSYAWIILLVNGIYDIWREWPMEESTFRRYIDGKYGSFSNASSLVHEYRSNEDGIVIDNVTRQAMNPSEYTTVSKLDYERDLNESKRRIRLIQKAYVPEIKKELEGLFE